MKVTKEQLTELIPDGCALIITKDGDIVLDPEKTNNPPKNTYVRLTKLPHGLWDKNETDESKIVGIQVDKKDYIGKVMLLKYHVVGFIDEIVYDDGDVDIQFLLEPHYLAISRYNNDELYITSNEYEMLTTEEALDYITKEVWK